MIIAITSIHNGIGKSTVCDFIIDKLEENISMYSFNIIESSFSEMPNEAYEIITGIDFRSLEREDKEKERNRFITFCEQQKAIFGNEVWFSQVIRDHKNHECIVISDLREDAQLKIINSLDPTALIIGIVKEENEELPFKCKHKLIYNSNVNLFKESINEILKIEELLELYI